MTSVTSHALGEIALVQQGYTFKPEYQGQSTGKWVYAKVADLNASGSSKYLRQSINYISDTVLHAMGAKPFPAGSIVFPRVGAALRNNNKRLLAQDSLTDDNVLVITVRNTELCSPEYLYYWFDFHDLQDFCNDGTVPVINGRNLKQQRVLLPSIQTQRKTAEVIDAWDNSIELGRHLIAAKKQHYTHQLSRLISRGHHSRGHVGSSAHVFELGDLLVESREPDTENNPAKRLTVRLHLQGVETRGVRGTESDGATAYFRRRAGQLIYGKQNIFRGAIGIIPAELDGYSSSQDLPAFDISSDVDPQWLYYWLSRKGFYKTLESLAAGSGSKRLHPNELFAVRIGVPPLSTQTAIARYLNALREEIALLGQSVDAIKQQKRGLMQKLLTGQWRVKVPEAEAA